MDEPSPDNSGVVVANETPHRGRGHFHVNPDQLLGSVGGFGRFQKFFYLLLCLPAAISAFFTMANVFTAAVPKSRCRVEACDAVNATYQDAMDLGYADFSIPFDSRKQSYSRCETFEAISNVSDCQASSFLSNETVECKDWIFDTTVYTKTIVGDFGLNCSRAWKVPMIESLFFTAVLVSAAVFGFLADFLGRRRTFLIGLTLMIGGGIGLAFSPTFEAYMALQFFGAIGQLGSFQTAFILGVENVSKNRRVLCGIVIEYFFVLGEVLLAFVAWRLREWRKVVMSVMIPSAAFLLYWPFLPESIRWLASRRKHDETQQLADRIAKWNGKPPVRIQDFKEPVTEAQENDRSDDDEDHGLLRALSSRLFVFRAVNIAFCWLVVSMTFYGLSLNATSLAGDPYLNFFLVSLAELPGYTLSMVSMERLGRRPSVSISLIVGGISIIVDPFIPGQWNWLKVILFLLGKTGVTCAFATVYLYTSELYPTPIRTVGVGISSMCGRIGAIVSPYVALLKFFQFWLPMVLFGVVAIASGVLILFLPETLGRDLPETLSEALNLGSAASRRNVTVSGPDAEDASLANNEDAPLLT